MRTLALSIIIIVLGTPAFGGTNVTRKILVDTLDNWTQATETGIRSESYLCGTNEILKIIRDGKNTIVKSASQYGSTDAVTQNGKTRVTSRGTDYTIALHDISTDGVFQIIVSRTGGEVLDILRRNSDGNYDATPQKELDELNYQARRIQERIPKASNPTNPIPVTSH
jgi:hypothetical protein